MAITKQKKEQVLAELTDAFKKAKSIVFSQYKGTNVKNMRGLRKRMFEKQVKFKVAKKTLIKMAAEKAGYKEIPAEFMGGQIGLAFGMGDEIAPAKILYEFGKDAETIKIVGAIFEGKLIPEADAKILAKIPGREILLAQLTGLMMSPVAGFYNVLHSLLRNFVYALAEVQKKKPAAPAKIEESKPAEAGTPAPTAGIEAVAVAPTAGAPKTE